MGRKPASREPRSGTSFKEDRRLSSTDQLSSLATSNNLSPDLAEARKHLIVALDFPTEAEALALVRPPRNPLPMV